MTGGLMIETCLYCGKELQKPRKLKDFCSYAHRGAHTVKAFNGPEYQSGLSGAKNTKRNRALQSLKTASRTGFSFCKINSIIYRLDTPRKRGAGWLMEVGWLAPMRQRWVARVGSQASEQLSFAEAKKAAVAMLDDRDKAEPHDWIAELNLLAAEEVDRVERDRQRRSWPVDLLGGERRGTKPVECVLHAAILETEMGFIDDPAANAELLQGDHLSSDLRCRWLP
jgi:hypothetical protein